MGYGPQVYYSLARLVDARHASLDGASAFTCALSLRATSTRRFVVQPEDVGTLVPHSLTSVHRVPMDFGAC